MMKFSITQQQLVKPLQHLSGILSTRPSRPITANVLLKIEHSCLYLTTTDIEIELIARIPLDTTHEAGSTTLPARKFLEICRSLPAEAEISITVEEHKALIRSGRSRFTLATLPANDFPNIEDWQNDMQITLPQQDLKKTIEKTNFSMANNDVRYFLNGMLFDIKPGELRCIATDGHRMALDQVACDSANNTHQAIVPRKGVAELQKLLAPSTEPATLQIGCSNIRIQIGQFTFTSKLIDGRFPDYRRVLPTHSDKILEASCSELRQAFSRVAILSNEKFRGVQVQIKQNEMHISANNPEQEEASESLMVDFSGDEIEIGFNVSYILDALNNLNCERVRISMTNTSASVLLQDVNTLHTQYVIMPIRL